VKGHRHWSSYPDGQCAIKVVSARKEINPDTLQRLARVRADGERVLSVYMNLDPERFATPPARANLADEIIERAVHAVIDQAADVLAVETPDLGPLGGSAALLRF
jgi:hypothetical protein